ncbi:glycoside hydrolase family 30 beta sandwich domain-containing protein [Novosphingobium sp. FKTRR1]|uniref:glycoside hydrolase family 30 protein n=1 Tax=Novosphingobium sp. FKTRR1 TaxID=2879118 RepID=UPI001CF0C1F3|nr:glycoside hydrolase family 30 protein [Novosphingobium sp. FKTRR1]
MKNRSETGLNRREALELLGTGVAASTLAAAPVGAAAAAGKTASEASASAGASWHATVAGRPWRARPVSPLTAPSGSLFDLDVVLRIDQPAQTIAGFGGAFTEKGWQALSALSPARRDAALAALFGADGCNFSRCRTPIGANDISRGWYSYDEVADDFALDHFSVANDTETLIPFIQAAQAHQPALKVWASPWSPPTWMKKGGHYAQAPAWPGQPSNGIRPDQLGKEGTDSFKLEDRYLDAYARYFARYVEEYRKHGIRIDTVMPQNEFNSAQPFPSCTWTPEGLARFVPYLGREMDKLGVNVFFGTLERGNAALFEKVMADPAAAKVIKGIGVQWAGKGALPALREHFPDVELWGSEQECGFGTNDWHYARYSWNTLKRYFEHGASVWTYWNMVMPIGGMSGWGWPQNALVDVDTKAGTFRLTEDYWLMRHIAGSVQTGARFIPAESFLGFTDQIAFRNPDGSVVLVASNPISQPLRVRFAIGQRVLTLNLEPDSLNTVVIPAAQLA